MREKNRDHNELTGPPFQPGPSFQPEQTKGQDSQDSKPSQLIQVFRLRDLAGLSISGVGPLFSVAATAGLFAAKAGDYSLISIGIVAIPLLCCAFVLRFLNQKFPNAGASYHWTRIVLGQRASLLQAAVLAFGYFLSLPAIIVPAASYTLALIAPHLESSSLAELVTGTCWLGVALIALLVGARPIAWAVKLFIAIEGLSLLTIFILGIIHLHSHGVSQVASQHLQAAVSIKTAGFTLPLAGIIITAIMAAPILDGWEVDSYAAEESKSPRRDPGLGGIIGVGISVLVYLTVFPLLFSEVPRKILLGSTNPMLNWGSRLIPGSPSIILLPIITSAGGVLMLISYILSRALFAMGRDKVLPKAFARLSARKIPNVAIIISLSAAFAVVSLELFATSLSGFFAQLLSAAGFFLIAEFFIDTLVALFVLRRDPSHAWLRRCTFISTLLLASLLVGFLIISPREVGSQVDFICMGLVVLAVLFAWGRKLRPRATTLVFVPETKTLESHDVGV